jgi:uncharacterized protein (DUF362 family)/Pyruvate/2-oxoacid:ferredoxin oxidoreductase delta subunit
MEVYYSIIDDYDSLDNNVEILNKTFESINLNEFNKILIKPNVLGPYPPNRCATTHPKFLEWILKYLIDTKNIDANKIIVGDSSGYSTKKSFEVSELRKACEKYNVRALSFENDETIKTKILNSEITLPKAVVDSDLIINLPKLKTHILMKYTGAVKNLYGCIPGGLKPKLHGVYPKENDFAKLLVELHNTIIKDKETITIMDGIYGMEGNGPSNGKPINSKIVIASKSSVAVDLFASYYIGYNPNDILTNRFLDDGVEYELIHVNNNKTEKISKLRFPSLRSEMDLNNINRMKFKKPDTFYLISIFPPKIVKLIFSIMVQKPKINKRKCRKCKICEYVCPVNAISIDNLKIDSKKCINCYCCHEMCGFDAIDLRSRFWVN